MKISGHYYLRGVKLSGRKSHANLYMFKIKFHKQLGQDKKKVVKQAFQ